MDSEKAFWVTERKPRRRVSAPKVRSATFRIVHDEPLIGAAPLVRSQSVVLRADPYAFHRCIHERSLMVKEDKKEDIWLKACE
jgi:hypothetical protein